MFECCRNSPLTHVLRSSAWGSPTSSAVVIHGPNGQWVSQDLPMVKVGTRDLRGALLGHVPTVAPNHNGEFPFIIELLGNPRQVDVPVWTIHGGGLLIEDHGHLGRFIAGFGNVIFVIEPDGENFGRP